MVTSIKAKLKNQKDEKPTNNNSCRVTVPNNQNINLPRYKINPDERRHELRERSKFYIKRREYELASLCLEEILQKPDPNGDEAWMPEPESILMRSLVNLNLGHPELAFEDAKLFTICTDKSERMLSKGNCKIGIQTCLDAIIAQLNEAFQDEEIKQQEIVQPEEVEKDKYRVKEQVKVKSPLDLIKKSSSKKRVLSSLHEVRSLTGRRNYALQNKTQQFLHSIQQTKKEEK